MAGMFQKLLGMGGQVVKRGTTSPVNPTKELMEKMAQEGPEVIGKGTSRGGSKTADDILDATFEEITPTTGMDDMSMWNRLDKKKAAALLGLGGAGAYVMSRDDESPKTEQVPTPQPIKAEEPKKPEELKVETKKTVKTDAPQPEGLAGDAVAKRMDADSQSGAAEITDEDIMAEALDRESQNRFMATLLRAGNQAGAAIAGGSGAQIKADYSGVEALEKGVSSPVSRIKTLMDTEAKTLATNKAKSELGDDAAMRDPNSEISKMVTGIAQKVGILKPGQNSSAMDLKNAGVNLGTLLATIEAGNARRDAAALARETSSNSKQAEREFKAEQERIKREDKRKLLTEEVEDRRRNIMDNINLVKQAVKEKGTTELFGSHNENLQRMIDAIAVDMAKLADPSSVARPSEVEMFKRGLFESGTGGLKLTNKTALDIMDKFTAEVDKRAANAYKVRGISPNNEKTPAPGSSPDSVMPMQPGANNNSGGMVKVMPPGGTKPKLIPADQVEAALAAGGKLVTN
jgi:hypothetical protein